MTTSDSETGTPAWYAIAAFSEEAWQALASGNEQIFIGAIPPPELFHRFVEKRTSLFKSFPI